MKEKAAMFQGYQIRNQSGLHYLTYQIVQCADLFTRQVYRDIIVDSLQYCQREKGLEIYAFVIMSNHIHLLARSQNDNLSDIIRGFKRHTSKQIIETIQQLSESRKEWLLMIFRYAARSHQRNNEYQVWTHEPRRASAQLKPSGGNILERIYRTKDRLHPLQSGAFRNSRQARRLFIFERQELCWIGWCFEYTIGNKEMENSLIAEQMLQE